MPAVLRRLDHPAAPAAIALIGAAVFVVARLVFGTDGDITRFIVVGSANLSGHGLPAGVHVFAGTGYDGQFYFREALDPLTTARVAHGIVLDGDFRLQRVGYPLLAYVLSVGQPALVPDALVAANVVALTAVGYLGGVVARDSGRHALDGLFFVAFFGFVTTLARDLLEIVAAAFLLAALVAYRRGRFGLAGAMFACDVLTKESDVFVVAAFALVIAVKALIGERGVSRFLPRAHLTWAIAAGAFGALQLVLYEAIGTVAARSGARGNLGHPFAAPISAIRLYGAHPTTLADSIWFAELAVLVVIVTTAVVVARGSGALAEEKFAFVVMILLAVSLSTEVWYGQADFRAFAPVFELAGVVLMGSRIRLTFIYAIAGLALLVTYVHRVRFT
ncbi:MAG TPA: hypothetical protein VGS21_00515 [Acidimicrobiales bacterium]|nr:hypothetical protein [Acidimicrobiales bacterium]